MYCIMLSFRAIGPTFGHSNASCKLIPCTGSDTLATGRPSERSKPSTAGHNEVEGF